MILPLLQYPVNITCCYHECPLCRKHHTNKKTTIASLWYNVIADGTWRYLVVTTFNDSRKLFENSVHVYMYCTIHNSHNANVTWPYLPQPVPPCQQIMVFWIPMTFKLFVQPIYTNKTNTQYYEASTVMSNHNKYFQSKVTFPCQKITKLF